MKIKINDNGLRDRTYPFKKEKDVFRIVVIGDSMTFGWGVEADESYPKVLEKMLNQAESPKKFEVINVSKMGSGPLQFSQFLEYLGLKYHPDLVVVTFFPGNDLSEDLKTPVRSGMVSSVESFCKRNLYSCFFLLSHLSQFTSKGRREKGPKEPYVPLGDTQLHLIAQKAGVSLGEIKERLEKVDQKKRERAIQEYNKGNRYFLSLVEVFLTNPAILEDEYALSTPQWRLAWEKTKEAYRKINTICEEHGVQLLVLLVPAPFQVNRLYLSEWQQYGIVLNDTILEGSKIQDEMRRFCVAEGIPLLDLFSAFKNDSDHQYYYPEDGHWNEKGHQLAAHMIYKRLKEEGDVL